MCVICFEQPSNGLVGHVNRSVMVIDLLSKGETTHLGKTTANKGGIGVPGIGGPLRAAGPCPVEDSKRF